MLIFTRLRLATIDKRITKLLKNSNWYLQNKNKDADDLSIVTIDRTEEWVKIVEHFIDVVLSNSSYKKYIAEFRLTKKDLIDIYLLMTVGTMPNPLFKSGPSKRSNTLVASSIYQEIKKQLLPLFRSLGMYDNKEEQRKYGHRYASEVLTIASMIKRSHDHKYGEITMDDID